MSEKKELWEVARDAYCDRVPKFGESCHWAPVVDALRPLIIAEHERSKPSADPYAELKAAAQDPTKQIRCVQYGHGEWYDSSEYAWTFHLPPDKYEIRDKPKPMKKVKLLGLFDGFTLLYRPEGTLLLNPWKRVPGEDKEIEVEE